MATNTALITNLCTTKFAILKWLQMLGYVIIVFFLIDGKRQWAPYTLIFICAIIFGILCLATLLINYFVLQSRNRNNTTRPKLEIAFNGIAILFCLVFFAILTIDYVKMLSGNYNFHKYLPPPNIGKDGWRNRILVVLVCFYIF
ncbi:hypothetical protein Mgra_00001345 [Meloidogyne graminicola]|uniref:Uncharacterized protein n=1 Tax=Meloidogyne graminicola TaxID=189291 RepID=A0A8T0A0R1_9BILA|nr:hypothetical protein Mgra_00001345 [Meloidogyne graminicola]